MNGSLNELHCSTSLVINAIKLRLDHYEVLEFSQDKEVKSGIGTDENYDCLKDSKSERSN